MTNGYCSPSSFVLRHFFVIGYFVIRHSSHGVVRMRLHDSTVRSAVFLMMSGLALAGWLSGMVVTAAEKPLKTGLSYFRPSSTMSRVVMVNGM